MIIMTINKTTKNEKLLYDINRHAAKVSALSSGKTDKHEYRTSEKNTAFWSKCR